MRQDFASAGKLVIVVVVWLAIGWLVGYLRPLDVALGTELPAWVQIPGVVAIALGSVGVFACGALLSTRGIGTLSGDEWFMPQEFLATGPFRFVRNPMSLAGVFLIVGIALWRRSTLALGLAAAVCLLFHLVVVFVEEPGLEKRFGDSYKQYKSRVARWVPRWPS